MRALAPSVPADLRAIVDRLGSAQSSPRGPWKPRRGPERVLAQALSLPETVRLDDCLGRTPHAQGAREGHAALHETSSRFAAERLAQLRTRIDTAYRQAFTGKDALPTALQVHARLVQLQVLQDPAQEASPKPASHSARRKAIEAVVAPFGQFLSTTLGQVQRGIELLRVDVRERLQRDLGDGMLFQLDALLDPIIVRELRSAQRGLLHTLERQCMDQLEPTFSGLAVDAPAEALEPLFVRKGPIERLMHDGRRSTHVLLDLEWSAIQGLIDAACSPRTEESDR